MLVGTICHKVLEKWDYKSGGDLTALCSAAAGALGVPELMKEALELLTGFVKSEAAEFLAGVEILGREVPYIRVLGDGSIERGAMDLLYRKGGKVWVADYKTGAFKDAEEAKEKWGGQGKAYTVAVGGGCGFVVVGVKEGRVVEVG